MSQEKRAFYAAGISFVVLVAWYAFFGKNYQPTKNEAPTAQTQPTNPVSVLDAPKTEIKPGVPSTNNKPSSITTEIKTYPEEIISKENSLVHMDWTSQGGRFKKVLMKNYREKAEKDSPLMNLLSYEGESGAVIVCEGCNFTLPQESQYRKTQETESSVSFEADNEFVKLTKTFEWKPDQYVFDLKLNVENKTAQELQGKLGVQWKSRQIPEEPKTALSFLKARSKNHRTVLYDIAGKIEHDQKLQNLNMTGQIAWAGIEDRYFLISLISRKSESDQKLLFEIKNEWLILSLLYPSTQIAAGQKHEDLFTLYVGPRHNDNLLAAGVGLEKAIDYGWFSILAVPILKLLQLFHSLIKNWGLAVILLTLTIKIVLNPLTIKSMKQMKEMQKLQPKLAQIKAKYPDDRQKQQMETMALFKSHNVNPMSGCLPMFLQMPVYVVLYKVLFNAIELYHAPFFGFYRDLSAPDPYLILPILLGFAMVAQQRLTPSTNTDPTQKQMMMIMPIMFTGLMLFLPLGLVLYIFVNTSTGVLQQLMYQRGLRWRDVLRGRFTASA